MFRPSPPPLWLLPLEVRAAAEWAAGTLWRGRQPTSNALADRPVLVLPGLMTTARSTAPIVEHLAAAGALTVPWRHGLHRRPTPALLRRVCGDVRRAAQAHGQPVSLVGWSMGGCLAWAVAARCPQHVRDVVTLGSPLRRPEASTRLRGLFEFVSGLEGNDPALLALMDRAPELRVTSVVSRDDGCVAWRSGVLLERPQHRTVRLRWVSHLGLPSHPAVLWTVVRLLSRPGQRLRPPQALRWFLG